MTPDGQTPSGPGPVLGTVPPSPPRAIPTPAVTPPTPRETRLLALQAAARHHGIELDREDLRFPPKEGPSPALLTEWVRNAGLWARTVRLAWSQLLGVETNSPVVLLLKDGGAALMVTVDKPRNVVWLRDPTAPSGDPPVAVDELRLRQVWNGEAMLIRPERESRGEDAPFSISWLAGLVWQEKAILRDVLIASVVLSILTIVPPLMVMTVIDRVIVHQSMSTLIMISLLVFIALVYETVLGYVRRQMILIVGARVDAKLNIHVFKRLLRLPLDFFERQQAGYILSNTQQVNKVREFLTGRLLATMLDFVTLLVLLPILFYLQPTLSWMVVAAAGVLALIIMAFIRPLGRRIGLWIQAEVNKSSVMVETIHGIRTVKSLALEPQQRELWDRKVAEATQSKLDAGNMANWPQTLSTPIEGFMQRGVLLMGAYLALTSDGLVAVGSLVAFMMLSGRVAQPLTGMAKVLEDMEEVRTAVALAGLVLNEKPEVANPSAGLRPRLEGALRFEKVTYAYQGTKAKALNEVTFAIPAGTMMGIVGRSGSGKSTLARLLQGISREYDGFIKLDQTDMKEINLGHLRRSLGVVLQENFLFRGTIRENILAGRPGLTLTDAVRAARLAGAEEFIERMPNGYETWIEEGSPNLSGGQRQRLAIARAVIHDPRILILDEATSALDPESEALVNANLTRIAQGRTMVIVSHRLSSLADCHQILVLDRGGVEDIGPHKELVERCPTYRQLWLQQNRHLMDNPSRPGHPVPVLAQGDD